MKAKNLFLRAALIAGLGLLPGGRVTAQTFTVQHSFTACPGNDGTAPWAGLIINSSGNTLYGTASRDSCAYGTVFGVNADGTGFTNLHNFSGGLGAPFYLDGGEPAAPLILSGSTLYGTASGGGYGTGSYGSGGNGTVFKVNTNSTGYATLYTFSSYSGPNSTNSDGANPSAGLILSGNTLYGTAIRGGSYSNGTAFAVNSDGTGFTNLHSFAGFPSDGANPQAGLVLSGNTLYGTASYGGSSDNGTVFAINADGTGFTNLHSFTAASDGANPSAGLILSGNTLYGTAEYGGSSGNGTVFAVNTDGTGFTNLYSFTATQINSLGFHTNSDGAYPHAGLILSGNTLYGTATGGGSAGVGTVFAVNINGTGFTTLYNFSALNNSTNSDGANPQAGLVLSGNTLYGTASYGGSSGKGTLFSLSFAPQLTLTRSGIPPSGIILSWPTNVAGFDYSGYTLQSTTDLFSPSAWVSNSGPVVIAGQNTATNPITGAQKFYRLIK